MEHYPYVIVGGGLAAGRAVEGIRRNDTAGQVLMICAEQRPPYHRPNLSKGYLKGKDALAKVLFKEASFYPDHQVNLWLGTAATAFDPVAKTVSMSDGRSVRYDKLLLALGSTAVRLPLTGADLPGVLTLRTIEDSDAIRQLATPGAQALVLGGSFMGSEVAASLTQLVHIGLNISMAMPQAVCLGRST
jgi:3-phenylpropionate/trans-cinnamate dioxygenase ferredoxin reductase subunit